MGSGGEDLAFTLGEVKTYCCHLPVYLLLLGSKNNSRYQKRTSSECSSVVNIKQVICRVSRAVCFRQVYPLNYAKIVVDRGKVAGWRPSSTQESRPCHPRLAHITKFPKPDSMWLSVTNVTKLYLGFCLAALSTRGQEINIQSTNEQQNITKTKTRFVTLYRLYCGLWWNGFESHGGRHPSGSGSHFPPKVVSTIFQPILVPIQPVLLVGK